MKRVYIGNRVAVVAESHEREGHMLLKKNEAPTLKDIYFLLLELRECFLEGLGEDGSEDGAGVVKDGK